MPFRTFCPAAAELRKERGGEKSPSTQVFAVCPCSEAARCFSISENRWRKGKGKKYPSLFTRRQKEMRESIRC